MRCQAFRSSSRKVRLRSVRTINSWGKPRSRNELLRTPQRPTSAGKRQRQGRVLVRFIDDLQPEIARAATEEFIHRKAEQILARAIHQPQPAVRIEGKDRDVDLGHDRAEQGGRFERAEALGAQGFAERIDFQQNFTQGVVNARASSTNRIIAFAQGGEQVRHGLQWPDEMFPRAHDESETAARDEQR